MTRTCQAPAGDVPAHAPLTARLCGRPATTSATVEGVAFALCAECARAAEGDRVKTKCCVYWDTQDEPGWAWRTDGASGPVDGDLAEDAELADVLDAAGSDLPDGVLDPSLWVPLEHDGPGWEVRS